MEPVAKSAKAAIEADDADRTDASRVASRVQDTVAHAEVPSFVAEVRDDELDLEIELRRPRTIEPNADEIEQQFRRHRAHDPDPRALPAIPFNDRAVRTQFHRAAQIEVAPRPGLTLEAELFERVGLQESRRLVLGVGEDDVIDHFDDPSIVAVRRRTPEPVPTRRRRRP